MFIRTNLQYPIPNISNTRLAFKLFVGMCIKNKNFLIATLFQVDFLYQERPNKLLKGVHFSKKSLVPS